MTAQSSQQIAPKIHALDSLTIDKIAAGEVIDLPSSCVKELVDNALDAGATQIIVEIDVGGRERIRVTDNGCGMCKEDVANCIKRHTTSKLLLIDDLQSVRSRGFRGEALASITSIAEVTIVSAQGVDVCPGTVLTAAGGEVLSIQEASAMPGTVVTVESLFYNVPARRKFLKSPAKDTQDITKMVTMLAFSAPHASFKLIVDGKVTLSFEALGTEGSYNQRAKQIFSELFHKNASDITYTDAHFSFDGVIASLQNTRSNRALQYLLINGRPVASPLISYTIKGACGNALDQTRHPIFALSIELDQSMIDINVHPQKKEVRFADEEAVRSAVYQAILQALFSMHVSPSNLKASGFERSETGHYCNVDVSPIINSQELSLSSTTDPSIFLGAQEFPQPHRDLPATETIVHSQEPEKQTFLAKEPICLAIIGDIALIMPEEDLVIALDLRATMRAVLYMRSKEQAQTSSSQPLLIPKTLQISASEEASLQKVMGHLESLGFALRPFGKHSYLVEAIPAHLEGIDIEMFILDAMKSGVFTAHNMLLDDRLKTLAHLQVAAMKQLQTPISKEFALCVFRSWVDLGKIQTAPDGSFCYAQITPSFLKSSIAKGNLFVCKQ